MRSGGGFTQQMVDRLRNAAYSEGYAEGQKFAVTDQSAMMNAYAAGYKVGCADFRKSWAAKGKKALILTITAVYLVASLSGGAWLFMPQPKPVRVMRAELVALPRKPAARVIEHAKHHHAAASNSTKDQNS